MLFATRKWAAFAALVLSTIVAGPAVADEKWVPKASGATHVRGIRTFANTPSAGTSTNFVSTLNAGVWKFTDTAGGPSAPVQVNNGLPSLRIRAVGAATTSALYAVTDAFGLYKSTDQGASWTSANGSGGTALPCREARAVNALTDTTILVGTGCDYSSGIFKSTDGGATWAKLGGVTVPDDVEIFQITAVNAGATLILSTSRHGNLRSSDSGATFAAINGDLPMPDGAGNLRINSAATGASANEILISIVGQGVFRTTNGGVNWTASNAGLPSVEVIGGLGRESATVFYVGIDGYGIYRTVDGGANWTPFMTVGPDDDKRFSRNVTPDATSPGRYYVAAMGGLFRTTNSGANWTDLYVGEGFVNSFAMSTDNKTTYAAASTVYKIPDIYLPDFPGATAAETGLPGSVLEGNIALDRYNPSTLYVTVPSYGLYKTTNAGANWSKLTNFVRPRVASMVFSLNQIDTQIIYGGFGNPFHLAGGGGIVKSIDGGANWAASSNGLATSAARNVNMLRTSYLTVGTVFAATDAGIYRSTDSGANWTLVYSVNDGNGQPMPVRYVETDRTNPNLVYAATDHANPDGTLRASSGVLRSTNGGDNWSVVLPNVRARQVRTQTSGQALAFLDRSPGQPGILRSSDAGTTWVPFNKGIVDNDISVPAQFYDGSRVVAVSSRQGIYGLTVDKDTAGDGRGDLFWRQAAPATGLSWWTMLGNALVGSNYHDVDPAWQIADTGDFDGDGRADLVWRRASDGATYLWTLNGLGFKGFFDLGILNPAQWTLAGSADLNGDGKSDIVWRGTDGTVYLWLMNGGTIVNQGVAGNPGADWAIIDLADMNGDGKADIVFRNTNTGAVFVWFMNGLAVASGGTAGILDPALWTLQGAADFNGDGKADLLWRHVSGDTWVWIMNGATFVSGASIGNPGPGWSVKALVDLDGDGKVDTIWRHTDGTTYFWKMNGASVTSYLPISNPGGTWQLVAP
jgi:FG-GAP-like repeat